MPPLEERRRVLQVRGRWLAAGVLVALALVAATAILWSSGTERGPASEFLSELPIDARELYAFAVDRPDVLRWIPCYCGCVHDGHASNLDCFVEEILPDRTVRYSMHGRN